MFLGKLASVVNLYKLSNYILKRQNISERKIRSSSWQRTPRNKIGEEGGTGRTRKMVMILKPVLDKTRLRFLRDLGLCIN